MDLFDLPPLDDFPVEEGGAYHEEYGGFDGEEAGSIHSDEFVDGEEFMAEHQPGEDSFLREATGGADIPEWSDVESPMGIEMEADRRASDIFVAKSRDMENVQFSSPQQSTRKTIPMHRHPPNKSTNPGAKGNRLYTSHKHSQANTAMSSDLDIHVDSRLVLTPNSFKSLQLLQQNRDAHGDFRLSESRSSSTPSIVDGHSVLARQVVEAQADELVQRPDVPNTLSGPTSATKAMQAGPGVIRRALHEIEAMLEPPEFEEEEEGDYEAMLEKLKVRLMDNPLPTSVKDEVYESSRTRFFSEGSEADRRSLMETYHQEEKSDYEVAALQDGNTPIQAETMPGRNDGPSANSPRHSYAGSTRKESSLHFESQRKEDPPTRRLTADLKPTSVAAKERMRVEKNIDVEETAPKPSRPTDAHKQTSFRRSVYHDSMDASSRVRELLGSHGPIHGTSRHRGDAEVPPGYSDRSTDNLPSKGQVASNTVVSQVATALPSQVARRCRRLLCTVGERMTERIVFSNGSSSVGRICVSILPLSTGCQQFTVTPAVLELAPRSSSAFEVLFQASTPGVIAGIFQFRAVGKDRLYDPYEILIEASVRDDLPVSQLPPPTKSRQESEARRAIQPSVPSPRVTELPSEIIAGVQISPTFLRLHPQTSAESTHEPAKSRVRITNTTSQELKYQVKCSHEHILISSKRGKVDVGASAVLDLEAVCRPYGCDQVKEDWCGTMTVIVEDVLSRELSLVIDKTTMVMLPAFQEIARARQAISTQTDSFYYTKKVNRRGLYFHARAVECGSCVVGESHQVPVFICNGSDAPMTVFLQALQEPFSCTYQPTTLLARKFIEVPVTFTPKAPGKVATCLIAYTVNAKAAVTLIARGVDKKPQLQA